MKFVILDNPAWTGCFGVLKLNARSQFRSSVAFWSAPGIADRGKESSQSNAIRTEGRLRRHVWLAVTIFFRRALTENPVCVFAASPRPCAETQLDLVVEARSRRQCSLDIPITRSLPQPAGSN